MHFAVQRKPGEQLQIHGGECGDAEHEIALRQARIGAGERLHQRAPQLHAVRRALFAVIQMLPKLGLPDLGVCAAAVCQLGDEFACRPCFYPIGAVHEVLVKHVGELPCELVGGVIAVVQIGREGLARGGKIGRLGKLGRLEQREQPPAHHFG